MGEKPNSGEANAGGPSKDKKRDVEIPSRSTGKDIVLPVTNRKDLSKEEWNVEYREVREALRVRIQNERDMSNVMFYWILQGFR